MNPNVAPPSLFDQDNMDDPSNQVAGSAAVPEGGVGQENLYPTFDEQFASKRIVEARGAEIEVVEVKPDNLPPGEIPIVIAGGWTEGPDAFKSTMEELYRRGRWVVSVDHPSRGDRLEKVETPDKQPVETPEELPEAEERKVENYHDVLRSMGIETADVIAHSAGATNAVFWARKYPDQVRNLALVNPAGLIGKDSFLRLMGRFNPKLNRHIATAVINRAAARSLGHGMANMGLVPPSPSKIKRAMTEAYTISKSKVDKAIAGLRRAGHKVGVIISSSDPVFPEKRIRNQLVTKWGEAGNGERYPEEMLVDAYASNIKRRAGHDELLIHAKRGAVAADQMLRSFEDTGHASLISDRDGRRITWAGLVEAVKNRRLPKEDANLAQRAAVAIQGRWLDSRLRESWKNSNTRERFVTGENARRNRMIAAGVGVVAAAGAYYLSKRGFDLPFDVGGGGPEGLDTTTTTVDGPTVPESAAPGPDMPPPARGDISARLNLPAGYITEAADGYEITAMRGANTDSVWRAAEHALSDRLGRQPSVMQIDALKDLVGEQLLDVGDKVNITNAQIDQALKSV